MSSLEQELREAIHVAGLSAFSPLSSAYLATPAPKFPNEVISFLAVQPPIRDPGIHNLVFERAQSILQTIASGNPLPPIEVDTPPSFLAPYRFRVLDGFHRFHLSKALGFSHIPVVILPHFDWNSL